MRRITLAATLFASTLSAGMAQAQEALPSWLVPTLTKIGPTVRVFHGKDFTDRLGEHALVLTREKTPSRIQPDKSRLERQVIRAVLYTRQGDGAAEEWRIQDENDCPMVDSESLFYTRHVTVTDLNRDGVLEVAVPYRMFCSGGVDSATLKIIVREGPHKYAMRGTTRVVMAGSASGGDYTMDDALLKPENQSLRQHLLTLWERISVQKY